jgi:CheY-like chemotaxis protein
MIEDNAANVELTTIVLEDAGFVVMTVPDAGDTLTQAWRRSTDGSGHTAGRTGRSLKWAASPH